MIYTLKPILQISESHSGRRLPGFFLGGVSPQLSSLLFRVSSVIRTPRRVTRYIYY